MLPAVTDCLCCNFHGLRTNKTCIGSRCGGRDLESSRHLGAQGKGVRERLMQAVLQGAGMGQVSRSPGSSSRGAQGYLATAGCWHHGGVPGEGLRRRVPVPLRVRHGWQPMCVPPVCHPRVPPQWLCGGVESLSPPLPSGGSAFSWGPAPQCLPPRHGPAGARGGFAGGSHALARARARREVRCLPGCCRARTCAWGALPSLAPRKEGGS